MTDLPRWLALTFKDGSPLFVQADLIAAIRSADGGGAIVYPVGFGDTGWIVSQEALAIADALGSISLTVFKERRPPTLP